MKLAAFVTVLALAAPAGVGGQVARQVADVEDGTVRFSYETKPGVEICDQGIRWGERTMWWRTRGGEDDRGTGCSQRLAEVELRVRRGIVREVEVVRSERDRSARATDLGEIPARQAASYLLSLATDGADADGAEEAIMPAMLADAGDIWRDVIDIAEDRSVDGSVRKSALFWLGQEAAEVVTEGLAGVALDEDEDQEIRDAAIFALSQRPAAEGVPILMELAKEGDGAETRKKAMFWLAQSGDDRVVDFFESILIGRNR